MNKITIKTCPESGSRTFSCDNAKVKQVLDFGWTDSNPKSPVYNGVSVELIDGTVVRFIEKDHEDIFRAAEQYIATV